MSDRYVEPIQTWWEDGIPDLGIPPKAWVFWWPSQRRYSYHVQCGYDHGVILNQLELGRGIVTNLPGPGVAEEIRAAMGSSSPVAGAPPPEPPASPPRRHLKLVPD